MRRVRLTVAGGGRVTVGADRVVRASDGSRMVWSGDTLAVTGGRGSGNVVIGNGNICVGSFTSDGGGGVNIDGVQYDGPVSIVNGVVMTPDGRHAKARRASAADTAACTPVTLDTNTVFESVTASGQCTVTLAHGAPLADAYAVECSDQASVRCQSDTAAARVSVTCSGQSDARLHTVPRCALTISTSGQSSVHVA